MWWRFAYSLVFALAFGLVAAPASGQNYNVDLLRHVPLPGEAQAVAVQGTLICVAATTAGLQLIDASVPESASVVGSALFNFQSGATRDVAVTNNFAYTAGDYGIGVVDISNPASPSHVGTVEGLLTGYSRIATNGRWLFASFRADDLLSWYSLEDPTQPRLIKRLNTRGGTPSALAANENVVVLSEAGAGVRVYDITQPPLLRPIYFFGEAWVLSVAFDGFDQLIFGLQETLIGPNRSAAPPSFGGVIRSSVLTNPPAVSPPNDISGVYYGSDSVLGIHRDPTSFTYFLASASVGLEVIDFPIYVEAQPRGAYQLPGEARDVDANGQDIYVASSEGLFILRYNGPPFVDPDNNAAIMSHNIPASMTVGQMLDAQITVQNTGTTTWRSPEHKLALLGDTCSIWQLDFAREELPAGSQVLPGAQFTFTIPLRAPNHAGEVCVFSVGMVQEFIEFFGETLSVPVWITAAGQGAANSTNWDKYR